LEALELKVFRFVDGQTTNFGDDLNRWLWSRLLGCSLDVDDGTLILGIGTVISQALIPSAKKYIVLSSGIGYNAPPAGFGGSEWEILSVRGPLTAEVLQLPPEKAIIDGAALLRLLPECKPLPASERAGIVFMPHFASLPLGNWKQVCEIAGIEFLDPLADSQKTVQRIRKAKLVIADAMHAAIVADALRVPWIPVVLSPQSNSFKWLDWTLSLSLPYNPTTLPPSTLLESIRCGSLRFYGEKHFLNNPTLSTAIEHYSKVRRLRSWKFWPYLRWRIQQFTLDLPTRIVRWPVFSGFRRHMDYSRTCRAAEELRRTAESPSFLSDERVFMLKLDQLTSLLQVLKT
jgi:succinoglycan biosynthesis protein ExoV